MACGSRESETTVHCCDEGGDERSGTLIQKTDDHEYGRISAGDRQRAVLASPVNIRIPIG